MPSRMPTGRFCRLPVRRIAVAAAATVTMMCAGSVSFASAACPGEGLVPAQLGTQAARDSVACLINEQRAQSGLGPLTVNVNLQQAAQQHSRAMNKRNFFAHGSTLIRTKRAGYLGGASAWSVGEVIAWGKGGHGTPKSIVASWMRSPPHRAALLTGGFQELGVGLAKGSPLSPRPRYGAGIYTVDLGSRR
jgi:uncharacterized protein YkwD